MIRRRDVIEVFPYKRKKVKGWKFRMILRGTDVPIYTSENVFDTATRGLEVARKFNRDMYCGEYTVRQMRTS